MENIVVKEIVPNSDKTIISMELQNGNVIKAFKTEEDLYTLGGYYDYETVKYLFSELRKCEGLSIISLKDCLDVNGICSSSTSIIQIPEGMSPREFFENEKKNKKTYNYPELDEIIKIEQEKIKEENSQTKDIGELPLSIKAEHYKEPTSGMEEIITNQSLESATEEIESGELQNTQKSVQELIGFFSNLAQQNAEQAGKSNSNNQ